MKQSTALDILKTGENVFLTGSAGSGKSYTINQYLRYLRSNDIKVAVTASTGIASTQLDGMTIHSWTGIGTDNELTPKRLKNIQSRQKVVSRIREVKVLIIDEISMLHLKTFDLINQVLKVIRNNDNAFGGLQIIVAGDFFQLPPVSLFNETNEEKFAFMSASWKEANFQICYLTEQHRQTANSLNKNDSYYGLDLNMILNQIRSQKLSPQIGHALLETKNHNFNIKSYTRLYTHNIDVQTINNNELKKLNNPEYTYYGYGTGDKTLIEILKKSIPNTEKLTLKVGAKVMFLKNYADEKIFNGTTGIVTEFKIVSEKDKTIGSIPIRVSSDENIDKPKYPVVKLDSGEQVMVLQDSWDIKNEKDDIILATYWHVPLTLAWAITIHKSQGITLDYAEVDLSKTFEKGQGYVALSRLKKLSGLKLLGLNSKSLELDPLAIEMDKQFIQKSQQIENKFLHLNSEQQNSSDGVEMYAPVLKPIFNKEDNCYYDFIQCKDGKAKICLALLDKDGNYLLNHNDQPKVISTFANISALKNPLTIGKSPYRDESICFYLKTFDAPRFQGQVPTSEGKYSGWAEIKNPHFIVKGKKD